MKIAITIIISNSNNSLVLLSLAKFVNIVTKTNYATNIIVRIINNNIARTIIEKIVRSLSQIKL